METLLPAQQLSDLKESFWHRYKTKYGADTEPSDNLLSRTVKKMDRRMLTAFQVLKVRTLTHQLGQDEKRKKLGQGLELLLNEEEEDSSATADVYTYLMCLWTLLLTLVRAGVNPVQPSLPTLTLWPRTAQCSWMSLLIWYCHTMRGQPKPFKRRTVPSSSNGFECETKLSDSCGSKSIGRICHSGAVVRQTMLEREAMWMCSAEDKVGITRATHATPAQKPPSSPSKGEKGQHKKGGGGPIVTVGKLLDGQQLCSRWNQGACKQPCPAGRLHACNTKVKTNGRTCGLRNHKSTECKHALRE